MKHMLSDETINILKKIKRKIESYEKDTTPHTLDFSCYFNDGLKKAVEVIDSYFDEVTK